MNFIARALKIIFFACIQVAFIPVAVIGLGAALYKEFRVSKHLGVSFSAIKALQYRWIMHYFNTRRDPTTVRFTKHFPCESHLGMLSLLGPLIISYRLLGFPEKLGKIVEPGEETVDTLAGIRVLRFDAIVRKHVDEVEQVVLLGSGFDLIAHHFTMGKGVKVYEIDQVKTLRVKVDTLHQADIDCDWITYVPVDFSCESWDAKLLEAGFDTSKATLFIWQSVSLYLDPEDVRSTLLNMGALCAEKSVIAQDFYSENFLEADFSRAAKRIKGIIEKMGEPWKFGINMSNEPRRAVESYLLSTGLRMTEYIQFGEKLGLEPFYCIVEAEKISREDTDGCLP